MLIVEMTLIIGISSVEMKSKEKNKTKNCEYEVWRENVSEKEVVIFQSSR